MGRQNGFIIGMDVGGTTARIGIRKQGHSDSSTFQGTGCTLNSNNYEVCEERYRKVTMDALSREQLSAGECRGICVAASGIDSEVLRDRCRSIFERMGFQKENLLVINDCEVLLHVWNGPGAVLLAGTGSIAMVKRADGVVRRRGGWGSLLSDEGSAFDMGIQVLRAVGNHLDNRKACPVLYEELKAVMQVKEPFELNAYLLENCRNKAEIAGLAPLLEKAAAQGDRTAIAILETAAEHLCGLLESLLLQEESHVLEPMRSAKVPVMLWGSVMEKNRMIRDSVGEKLKDRFALLTVTSEMTALECALSAAQNLESRERR